MAQGSAPPGPQTVGVLWESCGCLRRAAGRKLMASGGSRAALIQRAARRRTYW
jgi:hypothetical protein